MPPKRVGGSSAAAAAAAAAAMADGGGVGVALPPGVTLPPSSGKKKKKKLTRGQVTSVISYILSIDRIVSNSEKGRYEKKSVSSTPPIVTMISFPTEE
jgi:hypothetical protein